MTIDIAVIDKDRLAWLESLEAWEREIFDEYVDTLDSTRITAARSVSNRLYRFHYHPLIHQPEDAALVRWQVFPARMLPYLFIAVEQVIRAHLQNGGKLLNRLDR